MDELAQHDSRGRTAPAAGLLTQTVDIRAYAGRKLLLSLDSMHALEGGRFADPKWMSLKGELVDHGFVVATFTWRFEYHGGPGFCGTVRTMSDKAGEFIGQWLLRPSMGTRFSRNYIRL